VPLLRAKQKNSDSIGDKVTRLILLEIFDFSAPRNRNTIRNIDTKSTQTNAVTDDGARAMGAAGGRRSARAPHRLITMSKSRSSVAGSSAALNALFRAKQSLDTHPPCYGPRRWTAQCRGVCRAFGDESSYDVREGLCCAILRPMDEIGMVAVWLIIIVVAAIAGIGTDSPTIGVIVGVLATGFCGLLIIRHQPR
jgi:hypothetical protein